MFYRNSCNLDFNDFLFQDNVKLITEKQTTVLELVKQMAKEAENTQFLLTLRCTDVTYKDTIQKLLLILLENVNFKVCSNEFVIYQKFHLLFVLQEL